MPDIFKRLSFRMLPGCCLLCARKTLRKRDLCTGCENDLPLLGVACPRCALPLAAAGGTCGQCLRHPPPQDASLAAFRYAWPLDALIQRFKFNRDHTAGRVLAELFAAALDAYERKVLPERLLPVPLHPHRLRERGFNQSELLANALSSATGIAVDLRMVSRVRETAVQSGMNAVARRRNVRGAFALHAERLPAHVAIVDDVMTTGSTTAEIANVLRRAGVQRLEVWTLARAVPGGNAVPPVTAASAAAAP